MKGGDNMKGLQQIAYYLVVIGAINWGLVGLFNYNLVQSLFGGIGLANFIYILVGISGILMLFGWKK